MALHDRMKTALDETRTLILGAQILLGFQFQGAFQERFDALSTHERYVGGCALALILLTTGLLITPSCVHRIAEQGTSTGRAQSVAGRLAAAALFPFALALGLDLAIALERISGRAAVGIAAGAGFAGMALAAWYGLGQLMKRHHGAAARRQVESEAEARETAPLHARIEQMLTEARVILPGAQALLGFQLIIVLSSTFERLPDTSHLVHTAALLCVALAVILLITPAALHRIVWNGEDSEVFLQAGGRLTLAALGPLALGMSGDAYVVVTRIANSAVIGTASALSVAVVLLALWFVWPMTLRTRGNGELLAETK